jgi:indole-3-glycerol phosphate synthase
MIDRIVRAKKEEVRGLKGRDFGHRKKPLVPLVFDGPINIIAELKRCSPSAGFIGEISPERIDVYSKYARAISVLTDKTFFGGSMEFLAEVADQTTLPLLCKDFIIHPLQIDCAYAAGADIILLIARILEKEEIESLYAYARELGLACLLEIHRREEMTKLADISPSLVGVNSRDLDTLQIDLNGAAGLLSSMMAAPMRVAESGIKTRRDIERLKGANGFLIGESLMRATDPEETLLELLYG